MLGVRFVKKIPNFWGMPIPRDEERGDYLMDFAAEYAAGEGSVENGGKYTLVVAWAKKPVAASSFPVPAQEEKK